MLGGARRSRKTSRKTASRRRRVSRKTSRRSRRRTGSRRRGANNWIKAVAKARKELGVTGFMAVRKGTPLYKRAKDIYGGM